MGGAARQAAQEFSRSLESEVKHTKRIFQHVYIYTKVNVIQALLAGFFFFFVVFARLKAVKFVACKSADNCERNYFLKFN